MPFPQELASSAGHGIIRPPRDTDRSPVRSIRYKGVLYKAILAVFVICFLILGYYGTQPPSPVGNVVSQICTILYLAYFGLMPWYSKLDKCKPVPERLTWK